MLRGCASQPLAATCNQVLAYAAIASNRNSSFIAGHVASDKQHGAMQLIMAQASSSIVSAVLLPGNGKPCFPNTLPWIIIPPALSM